MPNFPQPREQLPQRLNPFNPYHYALLTYWVFFRPSSAHSYLYQASPEVYHLGGLARFWRGLFVPAYRRLYLMLPIALLGTALLGAIALWFYRQGMTAGHTSWVNHVAISGNGQVMVTAAGDRFERVQIVSADATLKVWDLQQGKELHTLRGHDTSVNTVDITQDGKIAVSGGRDRTLRVWDLNQGKSLKTLKGHRGWVTDLAILPNQAQVISASVDNTLKLWNLDSGENIRTFSGHEQPVISLAITKDGTQLISGSKDQQIKIWDVATGEVKYTLKGHQGGVTQVAVTPDQQEIISAATDNQLKVWDLSKGREIATLTGHTSTIEDLAITKDSKYAVSGADDRTVRVWDLQQNKLLHTLTGHQGWVTDLALTSLGQIISGSSDRTAKIWDLATGKLQHTLTGHQSWVRTVNATPDGKQVISTGFERFPKLWAVNTGAELALGGVRNQQLFFNLIFASCASLAAMTAIAAMGIFLVLGLIIAGGLGTFGASLLITCSNSILLSGALIVIDRFRNNPSFKEQFSAEALVLVLYIFLGMTLGLTLGAASGLSGRRAIGVFSSLFFTLVIAFAGAVITIVLFTAAISIRGRVLPAVNTFKTIGIWFNLMVAVGALRLPIYALEFLWSVVTLILGKQGKDHPILWDELLVLPLPGAGFWLQRQLQLDSIDSSTGLEKCLQVMINPWQRAIAQRALVQYLDCGNRSCDRHPSPLKIFYNWLENPALNQYFYPPVSQQDWQLLPNQSTVLLGELGHTWVNISTDSLNSFSDRFIWFLTYGQRQRKNTPLSQFSRQLSIINYQLSALRESDLVLPELPYPGGQEVNYAFHLMQEFLKYQKLADFIVAFTPHPNLELTNFLELEFIGQLQELLLIKNKIATYSQQENNVVINSGLLMPALQELNILRGKLTTTTPEIKVLRQIIYQWQEILLENGDKFN